ncbi:MAG: response regulator transcription factor [Pseudomonadota bacterium]
MTRKKILLVEDERIQALTVTTMLESFGYIDTTLATNAEEAINLARDNAPDLILMDIRLRGEKDGIYAAEHILAVRNIPVIYLTAYADQETVSRAKITAPFGYLLKPVNERDLKINIEMAFYKAETEKELFLYRNHLEELVASRTAELEREIRERMHVEVVLQKEIVRRKKNTLKILQRDRALKRKTQELDEVNSALKVLLLRTEKTKKELEEKVLLNMRELVVTYIHKLYKTSLNSQQKAYVNILNTNLNNIISPFNKNLLFKYSGLTSTEVQIANCIKEGHPTKEISVLLNIGKRTIDFHRKNIRYKLGLTNQKRNLRTLLLSIDIESQINNSASTGESYET